jgi:hypothetical protein
LAGVSGDPAVCGVHTKEMRDRATTPAVRPCTGGSPNAASRALITATGPPRKTTTTRRHAAMNAVGAFAGPREEPSALKAQ